jgi:Lon protease-like protein
VTEHLPLFPLGSVLFPGLVLPLHIFEDRYRQLVIDLLAGPDDQPRRFGVVALREGREVGADGARALHGVGCTAELQAAEPYSDGRFDIVTTGATRFRIATLDRAGAPYLMGGVEFLDEPRGADSALLGVKVTSAFVRYRAMLGADDDAELPEDPTVLSYLVASAVIADVAGKQALLEAPTRRPGCAPSSGCCGSRRR